LKLLHLTGKDPYTIMIQDDSINCYVYMEVEAGKPTEVLAKYPLSEYNGLEHFAGVIGKFMPYTWILGPGFEIEIKEPSLPELKRVAALLEKRNKDR